MEKENMTLIKNSYIKLKCKAKSNLRPVKSLLRRLAIPMLKTKLAKMVKMLASPNKKKTTKILDNLKRQHSAQFCHMHFYGTTGIKDSRHWTIITRSQAT